MGFGPCWDCFWSKLGTPSLLFLCCFLSLAAAFLPRVASVPLLLFGVASVLRAKVVLDFRCNAGQRASEGRTKPLGARSTNFGDKGDVAGGQ